MKNAFILIIVLVLVIAGVVVFTKNNSEAPMLENDNEAASSPMPVLGPEGEGVQEMIVDDSGETQQKAREFIISTKNYSFSPNTIKVKKGDSVKITLKSNQGFHDFVIDELNVATKQIRTNEQDIVTFVADKAGTFEYYCSIGTHRSMGMTGTLIVE